MYVCMYVCMYALSTGEGILGFPRRERESASLEAFCKKVANERIGSFGDGLGRG